MEQTEAMDPGYLMQIEEILYEGLASLEDPQEREAFLDQTCRGNPELRARLEQLDSLRDEAEKFFGVVDLDFDSLAVGPRTEAAVTPDADFKEGLGTRIGRYQLIEQLGVGGCGVVYLAEQLEPVRRRVALKIIRMGTDTEHIIQRFEMERQTLALMDHPNIARVLDAGATTSGRPFFVMQLVEGQRITDFCDQNRYDLQTRLKLFISVCRAIQHAHQKGIIHCDIKPSNIMVTVHDGVAVPKVIDFGIAKAAEGDHLHLSGPAALPNIGTPAYMSPEQIDGDEVVDVDTRTDIFSLGVVLHELLAGLPPHDPGIFKHSDLEEIRCLLRDDVLLKPSERLASCEPEVLAKIAAARNVEPSRLLRMLRGDLDAIVLKAMAFDRQNRYNTASGLATDLSNHLGNEPVNARMAGRSYRLVKLVRRNKVIFAAGAMVAFVLLCGFGASTWLFFRESHARQDQARLREAAEQARAIEVRLRERAQAGETVAHAAFILNQGDIEEADSLLAQVALEDVPASLESATTFRAAGEWHLQAGRLKEASKRWAAMADAIARIDKSDSESISIHFVAAAAAICNVGDTERYERLRRMAAVRFAGTRDPFVADEIVKSCLIKPASPELLAELEPLIRVMEDNLPWDRQDSPDGLMEAWQMLSLSLAAYRKADFRLAEEWCGRCLNHPNRIPARSAAVRSIRAMALQQLGRADEAKAELDIARADVSAHFDKPFQFGDTWDGFWFDWMIASTLINEADELLAL